ncbi:MAG: phosphotransferase, partial [Pseudomonadota bacterium]
MRGTVMNVDIDDLTHWRSQLAAHWDFAADEPLVRLDGEYDLNFAVGDCAVLKVMRPGCDRSFIRMQIEALAHCAANLDVAWLPTVRMTPDGEVIATLKDAVGTERLAWVMSRCQGRALGTAPHVPLSTIQAVGKAHGQLSAALASFSHPALYREIKWDLTQPLWARRYLELVAADERRGQLAGILGTFERDVAPALSALPVHAIHNDLNDFNILLGDGAFALDEVTGIIDFGDMIAGPRICDVAIAAAYLVLNQPQPIDALCAYVTAFCSTQSLDTEELDLLWPLLLTRLAFSVLNAASVAKAKPDDPYVMISQAPIERFLAKLLAFDPDVVRGCIRQAAGHTAVDHHDAATAWIAR